MHFLFTLIYILMGMIGLDIMILIHEMGHFAASRACSVRVERLTVGFGPKLFSFCDKKGTQYFIRLIPFGGSTKMAGHDDLKAALINGDRHIEKCEDGSLYAASALKKIIIYASGPIANVLFAILCFTVFLCMPVRNTYYPPKIVVSANYPSLYSTPCPAAAAGLKTGDIIVAVNGKEINSYSELVKTLNEAKNDSFVKIKTAKGKVFAVTPENQVFGILPYRETVVGNVESPSPESFAGLKGGDFIISANGVEVDNMFDLLEQAQNTERLNLIVLRDNGQKFISFDTDGELNFTLYAPDVKTKGESLFSAIPKAVRECFFEAKQFFGSLVLLFKGKLRLSQTIGGTIYASENIGMMTSRGFATSFNTGIRVVLYILASVSLSLGMANFLPITALDGGLIMICAVELFFKRTLSPKTYIVLQVLGIVTLFVVIPVLKLIS